jgi:hypothetical protein
VEHIVAKSAGRISQQKQLFVKGRGRLCLFSVVRPLCFSFSRKDPFVDLDGLVQLKKAKALEKLETV